MRSLSSTLCALLAFTATAIALAVEHPNSANPNVVEKRDLFKRQSANIVSGLQKVQSEVLLLNEKVMNFDGNPVTGILDALEIQQQTDHVGKAVETTTTLANISPTLDEAGSLEVATAVLALRPDLKDLLLNITSKKDEFDHVLIGLFSLTGRVKQSLEDQKALAVALGDAITAKLTGAFKTLAPTINDELAMEFDAAIAAYVGSDGIPIPKLGIGPLKVRSQGDLDDRSG